MGFLDGFRKLTQPFDEQDEDFFDAAETAGDNEPTIVIPRRDNVRETASGRRNLFRDGLRETDSYLREFEDFQTPERPADAGDSRVVNIHTKTSVQVVLSKPERFDQAAEIADHLREKRTVVMNLETTQKDVARRLVDFLSGVAYANDGKIKKVAINTYIITPYNVDIMGDLIDELENSGVSFY